MDYDQYWDYHPGDRVMTCDGYPGVVKEVLDGPVPGNEDYLVELDNGMGGGHYTSGMLTKGTNPRTAKEHEAAGMHLASEDYPELGELLWERPDPGKMTFTAASEPNGATEVRDTDQPDACSYCGSTKFTDQTDNGRVRQATCAICGGTMSAHPGAQWTPELIGDPSNHPSTAVDPTSGASTAGGQAGINDLIDFDERVSKSSALHEAAQGLSWDEIGERHPHVYGDEEVHGEEAEGADGLGIGDAANQLAHDRPEDPNAENSSVHDLTFHHEHVRPENIDFATHGRDDPRVSHAMEGYRKHPEHMPPLVLVHRHGVYQVADGHHRAEAAYKAGQDHVRAYVAYSPHPDEPFSDGSTGPYHDAEPHPGIRHTAAVDGPDWCTWRQASQCTFPNDRNNSLLAIPQVRGACPWDTRWEQQVCPISEPGPGSGVSRKASVESGAHQAALEAKMAGIPAGPCESCGGKGKISWVDEDPDWRGDPDENPGKTFTHPCDDCGGSGRQEAVSDEELARQEREHQQKQEEARKRERASLAAHIESAHGDRDDLQPPTREETANCPWNCPLRREFSQNSLADAARRSRENKPKTAMARVAAQMKDVLGPNSASRPAPPVPAHRTAAASLDLYHRTTPEAAEAIRRDKRMNAKEADGSTYWSTSRGDGPDSVTGGYGSGVVHVRVPEHLAELEDEFPDGEQHYRVHRDALKPHHFVED